MKAVTKNGRLVLFHFESKMGKFNRWQRASNQMERLDIKTLEVEIRRMVCDQNRELEKLTMCLSLSFAKWK